MIKLFLTVIFIAAVVGILLACPNGSIEWEGSCAALPPPQESNLAPAIGVVSDEKPSKNSEPAWQRGEVSVDMPPSCAATGKCSDQVAIDAANEGKKAAGLK
jgi:hypothetical protein